MAGVTDNGFVPKQLSSIINDITTTANTEQYFGEKFPTSPQSAFGILTGVIAGSGLISLWNLADAVAKQQNVMTASGIYLDYLARIAGIFRFKASGSSGYLLFTGKQATVIEAAFPVEDNLKRMVLTQDKITLTRANCYTSTFTASNVQDNTDYIIIAEGLPYSYNSGDSATKETIAQGLGALLDTSPYVTATVDGENVTLTFKSRNNALTTTNSDNITLVSVGALVISGAVETGALDFPSNTITTLVVNNLNIFSVTNPFPFEEGRERETDEEIRARILKEDATGGNATYAAIVAALSNVTGVTSVFIDENETMKTNAKGVPAKSYAVYVTGGSDDDIANVIFHTKPCGIYTYGAITKILKDANGNEKAVSFSRNTEEFAWLKINYTINSEEEFPSNGEDLLKQAVVEYGDTLEAGEDFVPSKFYGAAYSIKGIFVSDIEIATTSSATDTPNYTKEIIHVDKTTSLVFNVSRVTLSTS